MTQQKHAVLIAHGAWHTPAHYETLASVLRERGFHVVVPSLPTSKGPPFPHNAAETDIAAFRAEALKLVEEEYQITAIAHSYGGMVATEALHGLGTQQRQANGQKGGVRRILFVAAFVLDEGQMIGTTAPSGTVRFRAHEDDDKFTILGGDMGENMYGDLPPDQREKWLSMTVPHPISTSFYEPKHFAYMEIESVVVCAELDGVLPLAVQVAMADRVRNKSVNFQTETLRAGHFPSLSVPEELADVIEKYV